MAHALKSAVPAVLVDEEYDQSIRWKPGERFHDVFDEIVEKLAAEGRETTPAVDLSHDALTFHDLRARAAALAEDLLRSGVRPGDRVGLLFDRSWHPYTAMLAVSRVGAAWVPLDPSFPADRISYICGDAGVSRVLTLRHLTPMLDEVPVDVTCLDEVGGGEQGDGLPPDVQAEDTAYIIYTSGTTGRPKGVAVTHQAICNFIRVAAEVYGYQPGDRVYQGLTIAFDFSFEEIWVPLAAGATLVPAPPEGALVGRELAAFLRDRTITALCCVPTLLASLDEDLPDLRLILASGEACPEQLVHRWHRPGRRFLNVYGPTEATVSATWAEMRPGEPVTIGRPLPTYRVLVLDPETHEPMPAGEVGELAIAGAGLAMGYVNREDLTARAFIPDPLELPDNPSGRLYRTGDLAEITPEGMIVYHGRLDTQVKIRGYRIEVTEIESVLMSVPGVAQAAVIAHHPDDAPAELAAFYSTVDGTDVDQRNIMDALRERLPRFMLPAYLEQLPAVPMLPSGKVDRKALPAPQVERYSGTGEMVAPATPPEALLARLLAEVLGLESVSVEADFFTDLGADSFRMAQFCAAVRQETGSGLTTKAVYLNPTIRSLAPLLAMEAGPDALPQRAPLPLHKATRRAFIATGIAQVTFFLLYLLLGASIATGESEKFAGATLWEAYLAAVELTAVSLVVLTVVPIGLKWLLIGRWSTKPIPAWSWGYVRFWMVREVLKMSPARMFVGSPLYNWYLRALGAKVGKHALVLAQAPVCADLVRIGPGAVIHESAVLSAYRLEAGWVIPGRIEIGAGAVVGHSTVLDIETAIGDGAQIAHGSALYEGQSIPAGRRWHGVPAVDAMASPASWSAGSVSTGKRFWYGLSQLASFNLVLGPAGIAVVGFAIQWDLANPLRALGFALLLVLVSLLVRATVPRLASLPLKPDREYPLYGIHWTLYRMTVAGSKSRLFNELFGDSSAITGYLRLLGVRFRNFVQTGSNFGTNQSQQVPRLCIVGGDSLASDGLAMVNADYSAEGFRVRTVRIGERVFMGNGVIYPAGAVVGDDCLLATKVLVPTDGPRFEGVGLLGSPAFPIPRTVARDTRFDHLRHGEALRENLARKNRHNFVTGLLYLTVRFLTLYMVLLADTLIVLEGPVALSAIVVVALVADVLLVVFIDLLARGFRRLTPRYCSLYDVQFWRHERYWKLADPSIAAFLNGTPFKGMVWRLFGAKVGRMLLDDGCAMPERSMVTVGDHVTLGGGSVLHGHSLEDGTFKSDYIRVGSGVTVSAVALVHYGTEVGDGVLVGPDAFVMKGERPQPGEIWRGNPATPVPSCAIVPAAATTSELEAVPVKVRG